MPAMSIAPTPPLAMLSYRSMPALPSAVPSRFHLHVDCGAFMILFFMVKPGVISMGDMRCSNRCIVSSFDVILGHFRNAAAIVRCENGSDQYALSG